MNKIMENILNEEKEGSFDFFDSNVAFEIGSSISKKAIKENSQICVQIFAFNKILFHFSSNKCIPDNDNWLKRKINTVLYFHHSSLFIHYKLNNDLSLINSKYGLSISEYVCIGGGFPIIIKDMGVIGAIAVSGLKHTEDHELIVKTIKKYINNT